MSKVPRVGNLDDTPPSDTHQHLTTAVPRENNATQFGPSRIVGSQAKKQETVTRQGTQKIKFVPTLPVRRKKPEAEVGQAEPVSSQRHVDRGRGRGRGVGRGRGGPPPPRPEMQMIASGPFAMGPALAGSSKRRAPRSNFSPVIPVGPGSVSLGEGLSRSSAPVLNRERGRASDSVNNEDNEGIEVYSDPDEGVQIVDMDAIKTMDWMAPESLRRERDDINCLRKRKKVEATQKDTKPRTKASDGDTLEVKIDEEVEKNLANALDLSESEEEEELEDLIEDFAMEDVDLDEDSLTRQEKLYFFQFPHPFPTFTAAGHRESANMDIVDSDGHKPDITKQDSNSSAKDMPISIEETKMDGIIGQLEVHRSGVIKMRLGNEMFMDVTAATQPSFLQHAVFLDPASKKMHVLGEVNRRFVVSPDIDKLLEEIDKDEAAINIKNETLTSPVYT